MITDLADYLNNLLIAHFCGFDISCPLPIERLTVSSKTLITGLSDIMMFQVLLLAKERIVDASFIGLDSTPVVANTLQNNPKSLQSNKFKPDRQPKADTDCKLGVHTASNQSNEKNFEFY